MKIMKKNSIILNLGRGPIINEVASHYNGGGHIYASGVRFLSEDDVIRLIETLDNTCRLYKEEKK